MKARKIKEDVFWMGAVDWDRRLFDALIPLPDGTSYNAYLVKGAGRTALLDTVDPAFAPSFMEQLAGVENLDYIVAHHVEQDHSGSIPMVMEKYPTARVLCSPKAKRMLADHLCISEERIDIVEDGQEIDLGHKTLRFIHTPWVHWPETMCTYLKEDGVLFSCDFFGSHLATSDLYAGDTSRVYEAAKRYYAEIMMPFRKMVRKDLDKVGPLDPSVIAPSHGPVYREGAFIMDAYGEWTSETVENLAVVPFVSMHGSTKAMVDALVGALASRGVRVERFDLTAADIGKLAMSLVDAATLVLATPTVYGGPHPLAHSAAFLANTLRPKVRFASLVGSYGWGSRTSENLAALLPNLKVEVLDQVLCRGCPKAADMEALDKLAGAIAQCHAQAGLI